MVVKTNMQALSANRFTGIVGSSLAKNTEKLSSGYRINRAADDAAGLAISEKMRRQIRGLKQASDNAQDGISFVQIADGALTEVDDMLHRATELSVKAANGTNTDEDRAYIQAELDQLTKEIDRISTTTVFNDINIFSEDGVIPTADKEPAVENKINIEFSMVDANGNIVPVDDSAAVGKDTSYANSDMARFVQQAASDAVAKIQSAYPGLMSTSSSNTIQIGLNFSYIDGSGSVLASAALSMSATNSYTLMSYTMNVDTADYGLNQFASMSDDKKADLAATISHEMTHLIMYDTVTNGMLSGRTTSFPKWFVEGMAQTSSGDNGWVSYQLSPTSSDDQIKNYMSQLSSMEYGAGYLATMYLGQAAYEHSQGGTSQPVTSDSIKSGLDSVLTYVAQGHTLDEAIQNFTNYSSQTAFESGFKKADTDSLSFVKNLLAARGSSGAGSLLAGGLDVSESVAFAPASLTASSTNYVINADNTKYANAFGSGYVFPEKGKSGSGGGMGGNSIILQVGSEADHSLSVLRYNISSSALFDGETLDATDADHAKQTIDTVKDALKRVSSVRSYYGATQNRLEHIIRNLDNVVENTTSAESLIRDTDMSKEMVSYSNRNILMQAAQSMLAQTNQSNQNVLALLQ